MANTQENKLANEATLREHFAGLAMQGLLSGPTVVPDSKGIAICAVDMADALLKELSK